MKLSDVRRLEPQELMELKVGDKVWYCYLMYRRSDWDGDLNYGTINEIFRKSDGRRQVIAMDLANPVSDIHGFIIGCWQVSCENVFKPK